MFCFQGIMRASPKRILKTLFLLIVMGFVFTNLNMLITEDEGEELAEKHDQPYLNGMASTWNKLQSSNLSMYNKISPNSSLVNQKFQVPPVNLQNLPNSNDSSELPRNPSGPNASYIMEFIQNMNAGQRVYNLDRFDIRSGSVVVVIQVHNRANYLAHLLASLKKARGIETVLLIFSHDFYDEDVNLIIKEIDFCPYTQIFYPFPMQIFNKEFPGEHPNDCPRDAKKDAAIRVNCNNARHPDKYGHYREAKYTQTKHHWFWKINHIFDYLPVMQHHTGLVLFIEEDHYLVDDFLPVLRNMEKLSQEQCKDCSIMTLGTYDKKPTYTTNADKVEITDWVSNKHNMGMALNRKVWEKIRRCSEAFCTFDDYNWDWSLQYVSITCVKKLRVMLMKSPRIFHIGECGVHHRGKNCNPGIKVSQLESLLSGNREKLFPEKLIILGYPRATSRVPKPNGGWGDIRDRKLCASFTENITHIFNFSNQTAGR